MQRLTMNQTPVVPVDWHDAIRYDGEPPERVDHTERRLSLATLPSADDALLRRYALRRVERLSRRIKQALAEPLDHHDDANLDAALADLRRIRDMVDRMVAQYGKFAQQRAESRDFDLLFGPARPHLERPI
jgi:hypothetical protein